MIPYRQLEAGAAAARVLKRTAGRAVAVADLCCVGCSAPEIDIQPRRGLRALLAQRLRVRVENFVFPYGQFSPEALACVRANYRHAFRIGKASNTGWDEAVLYRAGVRGVGDPGQFFSSVALRRWRWRRWWNRLRGR